MKYGIAGRTEEGEERYMLFYNPHMAPEDPSTPDTLGGMRPVWDRPKWFRREGLIRMIQKAVKRGEIDETEQLWGSLKAVFEDMERGSKVPGYVEKHVS